MGPEAIALYAQALIQSRRPDEAGWQIDRLAAIHPGDPRERPSGADDLEPARAAESAAARRNVPTWSAKTSPAPSPWAAKRSSCSPRTCPRPPGSPNGSVVGWRAATRHSPGCRAILRVEATAEALGFCQVAAEVGSLDGLARQAGSPSTSPLPPAAIARPGCARAILDTARRREPGSTNC